MYYKLCEEWETLTWMLNHSVEWEWEIALKRGTQSRLETQKVSNEVPPLGGMGKSSVGCGWCCSDERGGGAKSTTTAAHEQNHTRINSAFDTCGVWRCKWCSFPFQSAKNVEYLKLDRENVEKWVRQQEPSRYAIPVIHLGHAQTELWFNNVMILPGSDRDIRNEIRARSYFMDRKR